jgi:hypothetical protein
MGSEDETCSMGDSPTNYSYAYFTCTMHVSED